MSINDLAVCSWMFDVGADENAPMDVATKSKYLRIGEQLIQFADFVNTDLAPLSEEEWTEERLTFDVYEAGKRIFGSSKEELRAFFKYVYVVLFNKESGPRLPVFAFIFGKEHFINFVNERISDPLRLRDFLS